MIIKKLNISNCLKVYDSKNYILKKRAAFLFYFIMSALTAAVVMLFLVAYRHLSMYGEVRLNVFLPITGLIIILIFCLRELIKGRFFLSANTLIIASAVVIWFIIFIDKSKFVYAIDTIVFIFAVMAMLPLVVNSKRGILLFGLINFLMLIVFFVFVYYFRTNFQVSVFDLKEAFFDFSVALFFSVVIHYSVFSINHIALVNAQTEIDQRRKAEETLRHSEETKRILIEAIPDIIMQSDLEGNILFANDTLEAITGITPGDYTDKNRQARIHPDDVEMVSSHIRNLLQSDKTHTSIIENRFLDMQGNIHWFSGTISKLNIKGKIVLQTVSRDITEKKRNEQELEQYRNHLERLVKEKTENLETAIEELRSINEELSDKNEIIHNQNSELKSTLQHLKETQAHLIQSGKMASLGTLTAGVAHEINNPLNYIMGAYVGLESYFNEFGSRDKEKTDILLHSIHVGINRVSEIVKGLNQFSRNNEKRDEDCDIHAIIDNCLVMLHNKIKYIAVVEKEFTSDKIIIKGNVGKLHQVFINILTNSLQAIQKKGTIAIKTAALNGVALIRISDTGIGIEKEFLSQITDPFYTTKPPGEGTGLGLSITYAIIKEHQGEIKFESEVGKGTIVTITLPVSA